MILFLLVIIILAFIGWAVWHFAFNKKEQPENLTSTEQIVPQNDSAFKSDSAIIANAKNDSVPFNVVINEYKTKAAAEWRLKRLERQKSNAILYTDDSLTYKIALPFQLPLADTTRILDSVKQSYSRAYVEVK